MTLHVTRSSSVCALATGIVLGALAMYFLDPQTGKRRRALARDQVTHAKHKLVDMGEAKGRDVANRTGGWWSRLTGALRSPDDSDEAVNARVRSRLGRLVSHPHAIDSRVHDGQVVLEGRILSSEHERMLAGVRLVAGVKEIDNRLTAVDRPEALGEPQPGRQPAAAGYMGETG